MAETAVRKLSRPETHLNLVTNDACYLPSSIAQKVISHKREIPEINITPPDTDCVMSHSKCVNVTTGNNCQCTDQDQLSCVSQNIGHDLKMSQGDLTAVKLNKCNTWLSRVKSLGFMN